MNAHRHYPLSRRPTVVDLGRPAEEVVMDFTRAVEKALGARLRVTARGSCLLLPPLHEIRRDGRALRGEEHDDARATIARIAEEHGPMAIRWTVEEMYTFDWDAFDRQIRRDLDAVYARLPGWLGFDGMPRWFGRDEELGPCLWASVEPPGLQVWGVLELATFDEWNRRLLDESRALPFRSMR